MSCVTRKKNLAAALLLSFGGLANPFFSQTALARQSVKDDGGSFLTGILDFFAMPDSNLQPVIDMINSANSSIRMTIYHLSNAGVENALAEAAQKRNVDVRVIMDYKSLKSSSGKEYREAQTLLTNAGAQVIPSSKGFALTHEKAFTVDGQKSVIMSLNITNHNNLMRDYGVVTDDASIAQEINAVFDADVVNAQNGTKDTPTLTNKDLVWAPVSSEDKLVALINSAQNTLVATVENISDAGIEGAMIAAAGRGVAVRLIVPMCDMNPNPALNFPGSKKLIAGGVGVRLMEEKESAGKAYMHGKMMIADGANAYIGSINYSYSSIYNDRELGVLLSDSSTISQMGQIFEGDWKLATEMPASGEPIGCKQSSSSADDGSGPQS